MLRLYVIIWDWDIIFDCVLQAISSSCIRPPCFFAIEFLNSFYSFAFLAKIVHKKVHRSDTTEPPVIKCSGRTHVQQIFARKAKNPRCPKSKKEQEKRGKMCEIFR